MVEGMTNLFSQPEVSYRRFGKKTHRTKKLLQRQRVSTPQPLHSKGPTLTLGHAHAMHCCLGRGIRGEQEVAPSASKGSPQTGIPPCAIAMGSLPLALSGEYPAFTSNPCCAMNCLRLVSLSTIVLLLSGLWACQPSGTSSEPPSLSEAETLAWVEAKVDSALARHTFVASNGLQMPYRLFEPRALDTALPLLVFLHGRGDRGTDNRAAMYSPWGLFTGSQSLLAPNMQHAFPCYVLVPQCSDKTVNEEWAKWEGNTPETPFQGLGKDGSYVQAESPSASGAALLELIDSTLVHHPIDPDRVYLMGVSMGGFGTWEYTSRRPGLFAAAVPMAGFSDPQQVDRIAHIPFWIFHGAADEANPVEGSRTMYRLLQEAGAEVRYTEYPDAEHVPAFHRAFEEAELIPWLFSKRKSTP